jgi:hypothetical protein
MDSINGMRDDPQAPGEGFKHSGVGREFGTLGIAASLEPRASHRNNSRVSLRRGAREGPSSYWKGPDPRSGPRPCVILQSSGHWLGGFCLWVQALATAREVEKSVDQLYS